MFGYCRIYYQNNAVHAIPSSCAGYVSSIDSALDILQCPAFAEYYDSYMADNCEVQSIAKACKYSFTKNPPYYCSRVIKNDYITVFSNAFANASAFRSIWILVMVWLITRAFPKGFDFAATHMPDMHLRDMHMPDMKDMHMPDMKDMHMPDMKDMHMPDMHLKYMHLPTLGNPSHESDTDIVNHGTAKVQPV